MPRIFFLLLLFAMGGCRHELPSCESEEAREALENIFRNQVKLEPSLKKLGYILREVSGFRRIPARKPSTRRCALEIVTDRTREPLAYEISWVSRRRGRYQIQLDDLGALPDCDSYWVRFKLLRRIPALMEKLGPSLGEYVDLALINTVGKSEGTLDCRFELLGSQKTTPLHVQVVLAGEGGRASLQVTEVKVPH